MQLIAEPLRPEAFAPFGDVLQAPPDPGFDVSSHGWRWIKHFELSEDEEREHIRRAVGTSDEWFAFVRDSFDMLYKEGAKHPKMMSIGLHMRLIGHPARAVGLERLLDYVMAQSGVWIARRIDIARHWIATHPYPGRGLNE
jgi:peptidoglycan/xylan/chitin deacetylase (PgdA/CDA1 family)